MSFSIFTLACCSLLAIGQDPAPSAQLDSIADEQALEQPAPEPIESWSGTFAEGVDHVRTLGRDVT